MLFIDALESVEEMKAFCRVAPGVPKVTTCGLPYRCVAY